MKRASFFPDLAGLFGGSSKSTVSIFSQPLMCSPSLCLFTFPLLWTGHADSWKSFTWTFSSLGQRSTSVDCLRLHCAALSLQITMRFLSNFYFQPVHHHSKHEGLREDLGVVPPPAHLYFYKCTSHTAKPNQRQSRFYFHVLALAFPLYDFFLCM